MAKRLVPGPQLLLVVWWQLWAFPSLPGSLGSRSLLPQAWAAGGLAEGNGCLGPSVCLSLQLVLAWWFIC